MGNRFGYSTTASQHPQSSVYAEDRSALIQDDQVKKVLRNTYALLAMTLLFSAAIATAAVSFQWKAPGLILTLVGFFGLLFAIHKLQNSAWALPAVFALTGFMGYTLGPLGLAISAMVALLSAGLILFETSRIVNGGESNYVLATVSLYVTVFNLFTSLLTLFGIGSSND